MLKWYKADLHIHTCLSPCGDLRMSPRNITAQVIKNGIDLIAICDHNSAENTSAVIRAAEGKGIRVLPGMEICTKEEIHVLAIFEQLEKALELESIVQAHLAGENDPDVFGLQVVANELDEVERFSNKLLIGAADLGVDEILDEIHRLDGIAVASHIDRESYSVISQLGFIPDTLRFDALEISRNLTYADAREKFGRYKECTFITNSDAHFVEDIGSGGNEYLLSTPSVEEISKALRNEGGRTVRIL